MALAPATIRIRVHIDPIETDRVVSVEVDGEDYYRASAWPVDISAPLTIWELRDLPAGVYEVRAMLGSGTKVRAMDRTRFWVR